MTRPTKTKEIVFRLDAHQYQILQKAVSNTVVNSGTTELEAGWKLGVQHVLQLVREGYVATSN